MGHTIHCNLYNNRTFGVSTNMAVVSRWPNQATAEETHLMQENWQIVIETRLFGGIFSRHSIRSQCPAENDATVSKLS